ncbi:hypothetical protein [Rhodopseudomonas palustris]|uniref:hypothetical protein n=1 Tax=Rhodopseudomonas palustris TaxID=1076 RepID=UPI000D1A3696|nr:hypothetical protein [Rhodopseudomonas palustris]AVT83675.1 hypothetical protein RPYSC3_48150 [Rhodopseudomonas palustris]
MKIDKKVEERLLNEIRNTIARDPVITILGMQEHLEKKFNRLFSRQYVTRMMGRVTNRALEEVDQAKINERIAQTRATFSIARERLMAILYWQKGSGLKKPDARDVVDAAKNLVMLDLAIMNAEIANGIYRDQAEALKHRDYSTLPEEQRTMIVNAFAKWGFLPAGATAQLTERTLTLHAPGANEQTNTG